MTIVWETVLGEALKLAAQLGGALVIARLTVRWALGRFKSEKAWERQNAALADLFYAYSEIEECSYIWVRDLEHEGGGFNDAYRTEVRDREKVAERKLTAVGSVAPLLFPADFAAIIQEYEGKILRPYEHDEPLIDHIIWQQKQIAEAREKIGAAFKNDVVG